MTQGQDIQTQGMAPAGDIKAEGQVHQGKRSEPSRGWTVLQQKHFWQKDACRVIPGATEPTFKGVDSAPTP